MNPTSGPKRIRSLLSQPGIIRSLGAHDVFTALIVEQAGFETVFIGGFGTSASMLGLPDLNFLTMTEMADAVRRVNPQLEIIVGIAPLLGLVGTIAGMMTLFGNIGAELNDASRLAEGIALILNATLIGLLIAIPSLIAWSYYTKKVEVFTVEMEALCDEFIRWQYAK
jgi:hypothetical protein